MFYRIQTKKAFILVPMILLMVVSAQANKCILVANTSAEAVVEPNEHWIVSKRDNSYGNYDLIPKFSLNGITKFTIDYNGRDNKYKLVAVFKDGKMGFQNIVIPAQKTITPNSILETLAPIMKELEPLTSEMSSVDTEWRRLVAPAHSRNAYESYRYISRDPLSQVEYVNIEKIILFRQSIDPSKLSEEGLERYRITEEAMSSREWARPTNEFWRGTVVFKDGRKPEGLYFLDKQTSIGEIDQKIPNLIQELLKPR